MTQSSSNVIQLPPAGHALAAAYLEEAAMFEREGKPAVAKRYRSFARYAQRRQDAKEFFKAVETAIVEKPVTTVQLVEAPSNIITQEATS